VPDSVRDSVWIHGRDSSQTVRDTGRTGKINPMWINGSGRLQKHTSPFLLNISILFPKKGSFLSHSTFPILHSYCPRLSNTYFPRGRPQVTRYYTAAVPVMQEGWPTPLGTLFCRPAACFRALTAANCTAAAADNTTTQWTQSTELHHTAHSPVTCLIHINSTLLNMQHEESINYYGGGGGLLLYWTNCLHTEQLSSVAWAPSRVTVD
jgi:hypothetical protein